MNLKCESSIYPNGRRFIAVWADLVLVGIIDYEGDGFLVAGKRKPVATLREAAAQVIKTRINLHQKEIKFFTTALNEIENIGLPGQQELEGK